MIFFTQLFTPSYLRKATAGTALALLPAVAFAQGAHVTGSVTDGGKPLQLTTVSLLNSKDSTLVKTELTDNSGHYDLVTGAGNYLLRISNLGYTDFWSAPFSLSDNQSYTAPDALMIKNDTKLKEVSVVSRKPMIEVKADKTIFNVENSINATGSSALELLRKSPGVQVDNNEHISMKGKTGVRIYIDGKPSQLDAASLASYLKGLNSADIESIEMISNPSAKYDASGNAGIINIKLKKNKKIGTNGSANLGLTQGFYFKENGSLNLNYRDKKWNLFGNAGFNGGKYRNDQNLYRTTNGTIYDMHSVQLSDNKNVNVKAGADYYANKNSVFGVMGTINTSDGTWSSHGRTDIYDSNHVYQKTLNANNSIPGSSTNANLNFNYKYSDTNGREFSIDADYGLFKGRHSSIQPNDYNYYNTFLTNLTYKNNTPVNINIYSLKADGEQNLWKGKFGYGAKFSYVTTDNTYNFYNVVNSSDILDTKMSNQFSYTENVNAGYLNYQRQLDQKWSIQAGVRAEQTNREGKLTRADGIKQDDDDAKKSYIDFFPSGALTWNMNQKNSFNLTYSRRIDRPTYEDLNPFEFKLDELTYQKGNAFLNPQYTNTVELTHTFMGFINTTIGYSHVNDFATEVLDTIHGATYVQKQNIAHQDIYSFNIGAPLPIKKWWNGYVNIWYNYQEFGGFINGKNLSISLPQYGGYMMHSFTLPKDYTAEISGWYNGPGIWGASSMTRPQGAIDLGVQKKFLNKKLTVKISATDILHTASPWRMTSNFGATVTGNGSWESQTVRLNITYMFGSSQIKSARQHETGLESEKKRLKG